VIVLFGKNINMKKQYVRIVELLIMLISILTFNYLKKLMSIKTQNFLEMGNQLFGMEKTIKELWNILLLEENILKIKMN